MVTFSTCEDAKSCTDFCGGVWLPRDFGLAGERRGKAIEKQLLTRSLVDLAVASRKPRPKVVAAPPVATFLLVKPPRHLEGMWGVYLLCA
jgi:hypothetical protein